MKTIWKQGQFSLVRKKIHFQPLGGFVQSETPLKLLCGYLPAFRFYTVYSTDATSQEAVRELRELTRIPKVATEKRMWRGLLSSPTPDLH